MRKPIKHGTWVSRTLFHGPYMGITFSMEEYQKVCDELKIPQDERFNPSDPAQAFVSIYAKKDPKNPPVVLFCFLSEYDTIEELAPIVVHECVHAWQFLRHYIGEQDPSKEFEAYVVQNIFDNVFEVVLARHKKRKAKGVRSDKKRVRRSRRS